MPKEILGTGTARATAETIERRSADVNRIVEKSVRGPAKRASDENARGPVASRTRTPESTGRSGERQFGKPL